MVYLWIHLITWVVLLVVASLAIFVSDDKISKISMMIARLGYIFAIFSGAMVFSYAYQENAMQTIIKVVLGIGLIGLIEVAFAKKQRHELNVGFAFIVIVAIILVGLFGIHLAGGYPFVH